MSKQKAISKAPTRDPARACSYCHRQVLQSGDDSAECTDGGIICDDCLMARGIDLNEYRYGPSLSLTEDGVSFDLDITGYSGKWKRAKELAHTHQTDMPYWVRVRTLFLELGGERKDGQRC